MRVLIAGASGYIGSRLSSYLADEGFEIIALCNRNIPDDENWTGKMYQVLQADVSSSNDVDLINADQVDAIVNLVSLDHYDSNGQPDYVNAVNVSSGWNLLNTFSKRDLKKYIYFSTIHVYGNQLLGNINEQYPLKPANKYGLTHLLSEQVVNYYNHSTNVKCTNVRLSNGYGAPYFVGNKCWDLIINNICLGVWKEGKIVLKSDGTPLRDFIHLSDILKGIKQLLTNSELPEVVNFSSSQTISMLDAAIAVKRVFETKYGKKANLFINENKPVTAYTKSTGAPQYEIDNTKFKSLMNNQNLSKLDDGINEIFDFLDKEYGSLN